MLEARPPVEVDVKPLTLKDALNRKIGTKSLPKWSWRPGHNTLVREKRVSKSRWGKRVLVEWDPVADTKKTLVDFGALNKLVPKSGPSARGIGRRGAARTVWAAHGGALCVLVRGNLVWVDLDGEKPQRLTQTKSALSDVQVGPHGNHVSFCRDHDLWCVSTQGGAPVRLTEGGGDALRNASLDWLYPEEFGFKHGAWWAPDEQGLLWLQLDQSKVPTFTFHDHASRLGTTHAMRYPKVGDANPVARLFYSPLPTNQDEDDGMPAKPVVSKPVPVRLKGAHYVLRVAWSPDANAAAVVTLDRRQQRLLIHRFDRESGTTRVVLEERAEAWHDFVPTPRWIANDAFLMCLERGDDRQWMRCQDSKDADAPWVMAPLTPPNLIAGKLLHVANDGAHMTYEAQPRGRWSSGVFRQSLTPPSEPLEIRPNDEHGARGGCRIAWSSDASLGLLSHDSVARARRRFLVSWKNEGAIQCDLIDDAFPEDKRKASWKRADWAQPEEGVLTLEGKPGTSREPGIRWRLWKPANFDPSKSYGLIVHTYAGPDSSMTTDKWPRRLAWITYMTQQGYLVLHADGRGSAGQGMRWLKSTVGKLSRVECADQATMAAHIASRPYVDNDRVGIWGWSFGGTMACQAVLHHGDVFRAAVAVAPVTDWRLYDTAYTERFMGLLKDNKDAFDHTSAIHAATKLKRPLLLMHGLLDNNVHAQNSVQLVEAFIKANVSTFDVMFYPRRGHGLGGANQDVFRRLVSFFGRHLPTAASLPAK